METMLPNLCSGVSMRVGTQQICVVCEQMGYVEKGYGIEKKEKGGKERRKDEREGRR